MVTDALLTAAGQVTLVDDGTGLTGTGIVRLAPAGEQWEIRTTNVLCSTRVNESLCRVYRDQIGDIYVIDGTYSGSSGDTSDTVIQLTDGQPLYYVWTGGDIGATATVRVTGYRSQIGRGFRAVY